MTIGKTRSLLILFLLALYAGMNAQIPVVVVKSTDKVIIAGRQYYIHTVKKGETLYSISKAYNVRVEGLTADNPDVVTGLKEGQVLKIPIVEVSETPEAIRDDSQFLYHKMQKGETIYSLSRKYGVDQTAIVRANPTVDIFDLPINSVIAIPKIQFRAEQETFSQQDDSYIYHKVKKGETLSSISRLYGVSLRDMKNANRLLLFPRVDDVVRVPIDKSKIKQEILIARDTAAPVVEIIVPEVVEEKPEAEVTEVGRLKGTIDVALLLPFFTKENSIRSYIDSSGVDARGKKIMKTVNRPETWVYEQGLVFLEFYQGMLLAVKELNRKGLNINLFVYDTGADQETILKLMNQGELDRMDLIIGPVFSQSIELMAPWASQREIPMVIPFPTRTAPYLVNNPYVFRIQPSVEATVKSIAEASGSFPDNNLVLIYSDLAAGRPLSEPLKRGIINEFSYNNVFEDINIKEVAYQSTNAYSTDSIKRIEQALIPGRKNLVVIGTEDPPVMSSVMARTHTLTRNYQIEVIGMPALRWLDNLEPKYYYDLEAIVGTPNWLDYRRDDVKFFIEDYRKTFGTEPTDERSYAFQGYDISYYFISGIAMNGRRFARSVGEHNPVLLQSNYKFTRASENDGYENTYLYLIQYNKDYSITPFIPRRYKGFGAEPLSK